MPDVWIQYYEAATSVVFIAANGDFWLWFATAPGELVREFVTGDQIGDAVLHGFSDAEAQAYLETRMLAAGYTLQPTAIRSKDITVWRIDSAA